MQPRISKKGDEFVSKLQCVIYAILVAQNTIFAMLFIIKKVHCDQLVWIN